MELEPTIPPEVKTMMIQHMGLGDAIICNAITRCYVRDVQKPVGLFINPAYRESIAWMYRDLEESLVLVDAPPRPKNRADDFRDIFALCELWGGDVANFSMFRENKWIFAKDGERFDWCFYRAAGIPFEEKFTGFYYDRDKGMELPSMGKITFLHDDKARGYTIDPTLVGDGYSEAVTPDAIGACNVFSLRGIIEDAKEIHVINSAFLNLIDFFNPKGSLNWHYYSRSWEGVSDPGLRLGWKKAYRGKSTENNT